LRLYVNIYLPQHDGGADMRGEVEDGGGNPSVFITI